MSVSTCLHFDDFSGAVWLHITDGESIAWFEIHHPHIDGPDRGIAADLLVNGETWRLTIERNMRLKVIRPGGVAPSWAELLERFGHRMDAGVSNG